MNNINDKKEVVGYVRTSCQAQVKDGVSVETQEEQIIKFCKFKGYELTNIFSDSGYSGVNLKRPGIQELLVEASSGKISKVICLDLSRLSRSTFDYVFIKSLLSRFGVEVVTITSNDAVSRTMEEMMAAINSLQPRIRERKRSRSHKGK